jgi:hypothetical protein
MFSKYSHLTRLVGLVAVVMSLAVEGIGAGVGVVALLGFTLLVVAVRGEKLAM